MERFCLPLVEFILLSEFDIDQGSILTVQYPRNLPVPSGKNEEEYDTLIPNMMLPDGCQNLEWDHLNFVLYRTEGENPVSPPLYGLNIVYRKLDNSVRRGAIVKALAILSPMAEICFSDGWATGMFPLLRQALLTYFEQNSNNPSPPQTEAIATLFKSLNETARNACIGKIRADDPFLAYSTRSVFQGSISNLIRFLGIRPVMELYRAILLEKNILFLAHNISASELCTQVLASTLLVAPVIPNLLEDRVFPYVSFNDLDFQSQKGFIAGTSNPFFKTSCNYDILVDLNEGTITYKMESHNTPKRRLKRLGSRSRDPDSEFVKHLNIGMSELALGETWIKREFQAYTTRIIDASTRYPDTPAQLYEALTHYIGLIPSTDWYRVKQKNNPTSETKITIATAVRKLCYAMHGQYKDMCRGTILSSLLTLSDLPKEKENFEEIISLLLRYFGSVDLTDAINRVTGTHDHENIEKFQCLNAALMTCYTDIISNDFPLLQF